MLGNVHRLVDQPLAVHGIDWRLDRLGAHASVGVAVVIAFGHEIRIEDVSRRLGEAGGDLDRLLAIGRIVEPLQAAHIVREVRLHRFRILFQECVGDHLED